MTALSDREWLLLRQARLTAESEALALTQEGIKLQLKVLELVLATTPPQEVTPLRPAQDGALGHAPGACGNGGPHERRRANGFAAGLVPGGESHSIRQKGNSRHGTLHH